MAKSYKEYWTVNVWFNGATYAEVSQDFAVLSDACKFASRYASHDDATVRIFAPEPCRQVWVVEIGGVFTPYEYLCQANRAFMSRSREATVEIYEFGVDEEYEFCVDGIDRLPPCC